MKIQFISMDTQSLKFLLVESNNNNKFAVKLCSIIRHHWNGQSNQLFLLKYFCIGDFAQYNTITSSYFSQIGLANCHLGDFVTLCLEDNVTRFQC